MDIKLAKALAVCGAIRSFHIYNANTDGAVDWFFNVVTTNYPDDVNGDYGEPFQTARGQSKHYRSIDSLMNDIFAINAENRDDTAIPVHLHLS